MELHQALKDIISQRGKGLLENPQIINYLLDYRCFVDKPATKLILRDIINSGYASEILSLDTNIPAWQTKFKHYVHEFIDSCGYKEELATYVFESIAFALDLKVYNEEPEIRRKINVDSFFDLDDEGSAQPPTPLNPAPTKPQVDPGDAYTIAMSFFKEGKYQQAKGFAEKAIKNVVRGDVPSNYLKLMGDILLKLDDYEGAIGYYNECLANKAKEEKLNTDELREALKMHKVKGYENFLFRYFYCLFFDNRIPKDKWLSMLKKEARNGSLDAVQFCAQYGIDPIENHVDIFFTDLNQLKTGDFLYEDGTFAHEFSKSKKAICLVVLTKTSDYEESMGWIHGYLVSLYIARAKKVSSNGTIFDNTQFRWSTVNAELPFPHSHYTIDDISHWDKVEKIKIDNLLSVPNLRDYPAFQAATFFQVRLPLANTSKWFLPSAIIVKEIFALTKRLPLRGITEWFSETLWTSSQSDWENAIEYNNGKLHITRKWLTNVVVPVAAF